MKPRIYLDTNKFAVLLWGMSERFVGREKELARLHDFTSPLEAGFMIVRGRRRIGKSWLLGKFAKDTCAFSFQGDGDSTSRQTMKKFAEAWKSHSGDDSLTVIRAMDLSWSRIFRRMTSYFWETSPMGVTLIFDEVQWIAKRKSGFLGQLKEAWQSWEGWAKVKIILCGSSQRFFADNTASETSVLHRMRTVADLRVWPFSPSEIQRHYFPEWTREQVALVFMMTGGVPYYLDRIPKDSNFIRAINTAFFTQDSIFLDEFREVLNLEFTKSSSRTAESLLAVMGQDGSTMENLSKKSTVKSESTVRTLLDQLVTYGIVAEKKQSGKVKANRRGTKFYIRDPFLNFYFQVLRPMAPRIRKNEGANLFKECLGSKTGYYIENFTGKAFELMGEWILGRELSPAGQERIFKKLGLQDDDFEVGHHWEEGKTQVDLVIPNEADRESRLLEMKWLGGKAGLASGYLEQLRQKAYTPPKGWAASHHLLTSGDTTAPMKKKAKAEKVSLLGLGDLFDRKQ